MRRLPRLRRGWALRGQRSLLGSALRGRRSLLGSTLRGPVWRGKSLWMRSLWRLALCPLQLQLLRLRGALLDMGWPSLDLRLLTRQREPLSQAGCCAFERNRS